MSARDGSSYVPPVLYPGGAEGGEAVPPPEAETLLRVRTSDADVEMPDIVVLPDGRTLRRGPDESAAVRPLATFAITGIQVVLTMAMLAYEGGIAPVKENPLIGPSVETLVAFGAKDCYKISDGHEYWRFLSPILLHVGVLHLVINLAFQINVGRFFEKMWGRPAFVLLYVLTGFFGNVFSCISPSSADRVSAGASGALFGLLGAAIGDILLNWYNLEKPRRALFLNLVVVALNAATAAFKLIDTMAHLGGFLSGFFLSWIVVPFGLHPKLFGDNRVARCMPVFTAWAGLLGSLLLFVGGIAVFASGGTL